MAGPLAITRRAFIADLGRGSLALAVIGIAGCGSAASSPRPSVGASAASSLTPASGSAAASGAAEPTAAASPGGVTGAVEWERVNLGFVSAYILVRAGEAAIVDTGVAGSDDEIAASLQGIGLGWDAVSHVILTHKHPDHAGSIAAVLDQAALATGYAGVEDLAAITAPRPLQPVADGDLVFSLRIVATPGHTAGHVAVLDEVGGVLVAGDALGTVGGVLSGSNPQFTEDAAAAKATVLKVGGLSFETLLVGHGEPILEGASAQVAALAAG
jgi:glyoxylase-like metal-dependent hydrolase (beta-lactamase superfamily II)